MQTITLPSEGINDVGTAEVVFSFIAVDGADPAVSSFRGGWISSITRAAEGVWQVTLTNQDVIRQVLWAQAAVQDTYATPDTTPRTATVTYDETSDAAGLLLKIVTRNGGTKDDCETRRVHVRMTVKWRNVDYNYAGT